MFLSVFKILMAIKGFLKSITMPWLSYEYMGINLPKRPLLNQHLRCRPLIFIPLSSTELIYHFWEVVTINTASASILKIDT